MVLPTSTILNQGAYLSITVEPLKLQQFMQQPKTNIVDKIKQKLFTPKEPDREM